MSPYISCLDCRFGEADAGTSFPIYCRRFPPHAGGFKPDPHGNGLNWVGARWPEVDHTDWCGEFQQANDDKGAAQ